MILSDKIARLKALGFNLSTEGGMSFIYDNNGTLVASTSISKHPYHALDKMCNDVLNKNIPDNVLHFPYKVLDES